MSTTKHVLLPLVAALTLISCGGGGGGGKSSVTGTSGRAVDGYLSGSTVFCDANDNRTADAEEMSATTDNGGNFQFSGTCSAKIVVERGTDTTTGYAFLGTLSAAPGSKYVTPLTTLLAQSGLTKDQLATALGLPAGTDVTNMDPLAVGNENVYRKTLAVQQIVQQLTNVLSTQLKPDQLKHVYANVAAGLAKAIVEKPGTPLFTGATINLTLLNSVVTEAAAAVSKVTNTSISLQGEDLTAVVKGLETQVTTFLRATTKQELDNAAGQLQNPQKPPIETVTIATNYIYPASDDVKVNTSSIPLDTFATGATVTGLQTITLTYAASATDPEIDKVVDVAASLEEIGGSNRKLQVKVEQVKVVRLKGGEVTLTPIPHVSKISVFVKDNRGIEFGKTDIPLVNNPITIRNNDVTVNYTDLITKTVGSIANTSNYDATQFTQIKGTFAVKFAVSPNLNVRRSKNMGVTSFPLNTVTIGIEEVGDEVFHKGVRGPGIEGKLTIK